MQSSTRRSTRDSQRRSPITGPRQGPHLITAEVDAARRPRASSKMPGVCMVAAARRERSLMPEVARL